MAEATDDNDPVRWGLGDACIGFAAAYVLVALLTPVIYALTGQDLGTKAHDLPLSTRALTQVPFYGGMLGWALGASIRKGHGPERDYRLRFSWVDLPLGLAAGVAAQIAGNLLLQPILWLSHYTQDDIERPARELADRAHGAAGVVLLVVVVAIAAPLVEEIFFRGLLLRSLERRTGSRWAIGLSSLVFAATHFEPLQLPALFLFGLVAALLVHRTGRLGTAMCAHLAFNGLAIISLLA
ncbi:MAG: CPBP family intramembrane glutamic endopeptidase [Acidimicrobiales bacterium]